jgi:hypothetical protein
VAVITLDLNSKDPLRLSNKLIFKKSRVSMKGKCSLKLWTLDIIKWEQGQNHLEIEEALESWMRLRKKIWGKWWGWRKPKYRTRFMKLLRKDWIQNWMRKWETCNWKGEHLIRKKWKRLSKSRYKISTRNIKINCVLGHLLKAITLNIT